MGNFKNKFETLNRKVRKWILLTVLTMAGAVALLMLIVMAEFLYKRSTIKQTVIAYSDHLNERNYLELSSPVEIYDERQALIGEFLPRRELLMNLKECRAARWLRRTVVTAEDHSFYDHYGISLRGIARAMLINLKTLSAREGGGSITQQLARNLFTSRRDIVLPRKIFETYAAFYIETLLNKDEILCLYLNKIYMGEGRSGADEAARFYFNKTPRQLDVAEAAMITGLFPAPAYYSPLNDIKKSLKKQKLVLKAMVRDGYLKEHEVELLQQKFIKRYQVRVDEKMAHSGRIGIYGASRKFRRNAAPASNEYVYYFLREFLSEDLINSGGLKVYTTINYLRQRSAESAVRQQVEKIRRKIQENKKLTAEEKRAIRSGYNGVLVALEPESGAIRAVVGGFRVKEGGTQSHRAWKMRRQTGSALKGFLYGAALNEDILDIDSDVLDEEVAYGKYKPRNWYPDFLGEMSLRRAVALSVNTVAVKTLKELGTSKFRDYIATALELDSSDAAKRFPDYLSVALGSSEMSPIELLRLYAPLLNEGRRVYPRLVLKVIDRQNNIIWEAPPPGDETEIFSEDTAAQTIELLRGVFDEQYEGTMQTFGRHRDERFNYLPFPVAGKSGTVQTVEIVKKKYPEIHGVHDAWFVGLVPGEVAVAWFGHDEGAPFPGSGSGTAGSAWVSYARNALSGEVHGEFPEAD